MKQLFFFAFFSSMLLYGNAQTAGAQDNAISHACFTDGVYEYHFPSFTRTGPNSFADTGTSTAFDNNSTTLLTATFNSPASGNAIMTVINNNANGCANGMADYFEYTGTFSLSTSGGKINGTGNGTWVNYCNGEAVFNGTWNASGPCNAAKPLQKATGLSPVYTGRKGITSAVKPMISIVPNPAVNATKISYTVSSTEKVSIIIYNYLQQPVVILVNETKAAGNYSVAWNLRSANGNTLPGGMYMAVVKIGDYTFNKLIQHNY